MIEKLRVRNFRCLRDVEVPLGPLNFLIGPNNTGKSSFLDAMQLFSRCATGQDVPTAFQSTGLRLERLLTGGSPKLCVEYEGRVCLGGQEGERQRVSQAMAIGLRPGHPVIEREEIKWEDEHGKLQRTLRKARYEDRAASEYHGDDVNPKRHVHVHDQGILAALMQQREETCSELFAALRFSQKYRLIPGKIAAPCEVRPSFELAPDGQGLASCLDTVREHDPERFKAIEDALKRFVGSVDAVTFPTVEPGKKTVLFREKPHGYKVYASEASDGLLLFLAYLTIAYAHEDVSVLLIEEPETGVNPHRLRAIVELLRAISRGALGSPPVQVIATSHSPYLLDWCGKEEITVFQRDTEGDVRTTPLSQVKDIDDRLKDFSPGELIFTFGEQICESRS